ncbi:EamA family transporter RarD [Tianweitania sp. BSSL-BM11]|uniref:EamA family transporter RarD n=1 Tax=Tianweitania aestuarii TaxID=2814886 RepID=A0ABS5RSL8_9HYPH|nr:EamA family transporter RarD [Tianweitania aestuarii]MBS9719962.1 EamA family transporter RarD [Tianweitania aestuarii]
MTNVPSSPTPAPAAETRGFIYAGTAYLIWGCLFPLLMKLVAHIPAAEVIAHRVIWSVPIAAGVVLWLGRTADIRAALRSPRTLLMATVTAAAVTVNWGVYVWAISVNRTVEAALGYYINPLVTIAIGALIMGEKLDRLQLGAIALAAIGVALVTIETGGLPWISLLLALSFAIYGFLRKTLPIGPSQGFFLETMILLIAALPYVIWLAVTGQGHFVAGGASDTLWLLVCGPATAIPLLLYGFGAKLLRITTIGIMQYIVPTGLFLLAIFVFGEPFGWHRAIAFAFIWVALIIYTASLLMRRRPTTELPLTRAAGS